MTRTTTADCAAGSGRRRVAVVAGDPAGLGRAIAGRLASRPTEVVLIDDAPGPDRSGSVRAEVADWGDVSGLQALVERLASELGGIDELVNLPVTAPGAGFFDVDQPEWDRAFAANSKRVYFLMQAVARVMRRQGGGRIVNVVTVDGKGWWGTRSPAPAGTEAAVIAVDRIVALQVAADDINVNTVCCGLLAHENAFVALDGTARQARGTVGQAQRLVPLDRANEPDDVAAVVEFLLSPGARNITGQCLNVDGGLIFD